MRRYRNPVHPRRRTSVRGASEQLEPKLLLTDFVLDGALDNKPLDLRLTVVQDEIQLVARGSGDVVKSQAIDASLSGVRIVGSALDDFLEVEKLPANVSLSFDGLGRSDTLLGYAEDLTWHVDGENQGRLGDRATFTNVEYLQGAADNEDTFIFSEIGVLAESIHGGDGGFDTLVLNGHYDKVTFGASGPHSGFVELDGAMLQYDGLEPITLTQSAGIIQIDADLIPRSGSELLGDKTPRADKLVLENDAVEGRNVLRNRFPSNATIETVHFSNPTDKLIINLGGKDDELWLRSIDSKFNADLEINGNEGKDTVSIDCLLACDGSIFRAKDLVIDAESVTFASETAVSDLIVNAKHNITVLRASKITAKGKVSLSATASLDEAARAAATIRVHGTIIAEKTVELTAKTEGNRNVTESEAARNAGNEQLQIMLMAANIQAKEGLTIEASTGTHYAATGAHASNSIGGAILVFSNLSEIKTANGNIQILASDASTLTANANGAAEEDPQGLAARNRLNRPINIRVVRSDLAAPQGDIKLEAKRVAKLTATARTTQNTGDSGGDLSLKLAGSYASNTLLGDVIADVSGLGHKFVAGSSKDAVLSATDEPILDARTRIGHSPQTSPGVAGASGGFGGAIAFNTIGWDSDTLDPPKEVFNPDQKTIEVGDSKEEITNTYKEPLFGVINTLLNTNFGTDRKIRVRADISELNVSAGSIRLTSEANRKVNSTVSNAQQTQAQGVVSSSSAATSGILVSNMLNALTESHIKDSQNITADGSITVSAKDTSKIAANSKIVSSSNSSDGAADFISDLADGVDKADYKTDAEAAKTASLKFGDKVQLAATHLAGGTPGGIYEFLGQDGVNPTTKTTGTTDLSQVDYSNLDFWKKVSAPTDVNLIRADSASVAGQVVRNDIRSDVSAYIEKSHVTSTNGDIDVIAMATPSIKATIDSTSASSGGSVFGTGKSLAIDGVIATNLVQSQVKAYIDQSTVTVDVNGDGHLTVKADNESTIEANVHSAVTTGENGVGLILAFNTIGYESQNLLFEGIDALLGTKIGNETPAEAKAYVHNSTVKTGGDLKLDANSVAHISSTIDNNATSAPTALFGASGMSAAGVLASNKVSSKALAYIHNDTLAKTSSGSTPNTVYSIDVGKDLDINSHDASTILAKTEMVTGVKVNNDLAVGIVNKLIDKTRDSYRVTSKSGSRKVKFGDLVRVASDYDSTKGNPGRVYKYMGEVERTIDLGAENYTDFGYWLQVDASNLLPAGFSHGAKKVFELTERKSGKKIPGGTALTMFGLVAQNSVTSDVASYIKDTNTRAKGNMSLVARDAARISALENSVVDTGGAPSSAGGAVIATNQLLSKSNAYIQDSLVVTTGTGSDVSLDADNVSQIDASTLSVVKVSRTGNAVSPVLAFNSMGWDDPIIFTKALSVLLGNDVEVGEEPVEVQAYIKNSKVTATGDLSVTADSEERVFELTTLTSEQLDDLGNQAKDDEASKDKNEAAEDKTADAQLLSNLRDAFKTQDIECQLVSTSSSSKRLSRANNGNWSTTNRVGCTKKEMVGFSPLPQTVTCSASRVQACCTPPLGAPHPPMRRMIEHC